MHRLEVAAFLLRRQHVLTVAEVPLAHCAVLLRTLAVSFFGVHQQVLLYFGEVKSCSVEGRPCSAEEMSPLEDWRQHFLTLSFHLLSCRLL